MGRQKIVAGNWKMNTSLQEAQMLVKQIIKHAVNSPQNNAKDIIKIIIPPFPFLESIGHLISQTVNFYTGAQNCHTNSNGAYTGEVSAAMLYSAGCAYVLIGHSERRNYFNETDGDFILKIKQAINNNLQPIFCVGETSEDRQSNKHFQIIAHQLSAVLNSFSTEEFSKIIIAYEPVWAIGTGQTATAQQAQEIHAFIRSKIAEIYNQSAANNVTILYGGSCNTTNAKELFACSDVDGGLIGGASLKADDFCKIICSF